MLMAILYERDAAVFAFTDPAGHKRVSTHLALIDTSLGLMMAANGTGSCCVKIDSVRTGGRYMIGYPEWQAAQAPGADCFEIHDEGPATSPRIVPVNAAGEHLTEYAQEIYHEKDAQKPFPEAACRNERPLGNVVAVRLRDFQWAARLVSLGEPNDKVLLDQAQPGYPLRWAIWRDGIPVAEHERPVGIIAAGYLGTKDGGEEAEAIIDFLANGHPPYPSDEEPAAEETEAPADPPEESSEAPAEDEGAEASEDEAEEAADPYAANDEFNEDSEPTAEEEVAANSAAAEKILSRTPARALDDPTAAYMAAKYKVERCLDRLRAGDTSRATAAELRTQVSIADLALEAADEDWLKDEWKAIKAEAEAVQPA